VTIVFLFDFDLLKGVETCKSELIELATSCEAPKTDDVPASDDGNDLDEEDNTTSEPDINKYCFHLNKKAYLFGTIEISIVCW
jgi:hypothetical protein